MSNSSNNGGNVNEEYELESHGTWHSSQLNIEHIESNATNNTVANNIVLPIHHHSTPSDTSNTTNNTLPNAIINGNHHHPTTSESTDGIRSFIDPHFAIRYQQYQQNNTFEDDDTVIIIEDSDSDSSIYNNNTNNNNNNNNNSNSNSNSNFGGQFDYCSCQTDDFVLDAIHSL